MVLKKEVPQRCWGKKRALFPASNKKQGQTQREEKPTLHAHKKHHSKKQQ
jgi:hypothetical protein